MNEKDGENIINTMFEKALEELNDGETVQFVTDVGIEEYGIEVTNAMLRNMGISNIQYSADFSHNYPNMAVVILSEMDDYYTQKDISFLGIEVDDVSKLDVKRYEENGVLHADHVIMGFDVSHEDVSSLEAMFYDDVRLYFTNKRL